MKSGRKLFVAYLDELQGVQINSQCIWFYDPKTKSMRYCQKLWKGKRGNVS